jgi:predicted house-cleaning NTP pyrophosphatase (Maf/HAM1 superfamily)
MANKALQWTAIPLRSIAASELCRYCAKRSLEHLAGCKSLSGKG